MEDLKRMIKKWAEAYGNLLKEILGLYKTMKDTLYKTLKQKDPKDTLRHWRARLPPEKDHDYICEVLRQHISDQKDSIDNKQKIDEIKKKYIASYNVPDNEIEDITALLHFFYINGKEKPCTTKITDPSTKIEYDTDDTLDPSAQVVAATSSDTSTEGISISAFEKRLFDQSKSTATTAHSFKLNVNDLCDASWTQGSLGKILRATDAKNINLDLSGSNIISIRKRVFYGCTNLASITIPNSVASIELGAFEGCTNLTSIIFEGCTSLFSIGDRAFEGCTSLASIGNWAFYGCTSLTSITIPDSVTSIGLGAFRGCTKLTSVKIQGTKTGFKHSFDFSLGNLRDEYLTGGIGTYITTEPMGSRSVWTKQPN
jgi:hypothetical protein